MTFEIGKDSTMSELESSLPLLEPLFRAGIPVWLVGGAVRDRVAGERPRDLDFFAEAEGEILRRLLPRGSSVGGRIPTLVLPREKGKAPLQISGGSGGLLADLARRDFSVNAMAWRVGPDGLKGEIVDPFHGREDLRKRLLRVPQSSRDPFREDPVRVLRLLRFVATGGYSVEAGTEEMARSAVEGLASVAGERRLRELGLFWEGAHLARVIERVPGSFCERVLRAAIFGNSLPAPLRTEPEGRGSCFLPAVRPETISGSVRMWIFAWEAAGAAGGVESRWGRSLWRGRGGADLPLSRSDRHFLVTLDRLRSVLSSWPAVGPLDPRDLVLIGRDPSGGEVARLVARGLPEGLRDRFFQWARQEERESRRLAEEGVRSLPRRKN